jgi:hypothetical protein
MTSIASRRGLLAVAVALACTPVLAAQPQNPGNGERKAAQRAAFLRGDASTKAPPKQQPSTEAEALAARKVLPNGIIELQLPEDRMLELTAVRNADGSLTVGHHDLDATHAPKQEASHD